MPTKLNRSILIIDNGSATYLAETFTKYFDKVYYHSPIKSQFKDYILGSVGTGIKGVTRLNQWEQMENEIDYFYFTDLGWEDVAHRLRSEGKKVWGGTPACFIEENRELFIDKLKDVGLQSATYEKITGIGNLREYLKDKKDKFIKASFWRYENETKHWHSYAHNKVWLDEKAVQLQGKSDSFEFLVFDPIKCKAEIGWDGYSVNGKMPDKGIFGLEIKDAGWAGVTWDKKHFPPAINEVNEKFGKALAEYNNCGMFSTEIRWNSDTDFKFTDPVIDRSPEPPGAWQTSCITNFGDIIVGACDGIIVEPEYIDDYGCQIILKSESVSDSGLNLQIPDKYKDLVRLKAYYEDKGEYYVIPFKKMNITMSEFGATIGWGKTVDAAIEMALEAAENIICDDYYYAKDAGDKAKTILDDLYSFGIKF